MSYLLDTNVVSELRKRHRAASLVLEWFRLAARAEFFISVLTVMEIEKGVRQLERRDALQASKIRAWKEGLLSRRFRGRCLDIDLEIAECSAAHHAPDPRPEIDSLIAATAIVKGLTLVTRNERDFAGIPVALVNPWASRSTREP
jgi:toxin FitB